MRLKGHGRNCMSLNIDHSSSNNVAFGKLKDFHRFSGKKLELKSFEAEY
jgi:hypothetical protein